MHFKTLFYLTLHVLAVSNCHVCVVPGFLTGAQTNDSKSGYNEYSQLGRIISVFILHFLFYKFSPIYFAQLGWISSQLLCFLFSRFCYLLFFGIIWCLFID